MAFIDWSTQMLNLVAGSLTIALPFVIPTVLLFFDQTGRLSNLKGYAIAFALAAGASLAIGCLWLARIIGFAWDPTIAVWLVNAFFAFMIPPVIVLSDRGEGENDAMIYSYGALLGITVLVLLAMITGFGPLSPAQAVEHKIVCQD